MLYFQLMLPKTQRNSRIVKWFGLKGILKYHLVTHPCHGQKHLSVHQVDQIPIKPNFEHLL